MNMDIISIEDGKDLKVIKTDIARAGNILSVQLGELEYAPNFGVDLRYFLESDFQIQNASFKSYLVQRLMEHQVSVVNVLSKFDQLFEVMTFEIGDTDTGTELIS